MISTYKTDDAFFTLILPPFSFYGFSVKNWFTNHGIAKFRYIKDVEIEREFWNLQQVHDVYPGIKTITITVNPWARMRYAYLELRKMKKAGNTAFLDLSILKLDSFDDFIMSLTDMKPIEAYWFTFATPTCRWVEYQQDEKTETVDFILKSENLEKDFKVIQEYFCSDEKLLLSKKLPGYKKFYNDTTRSIVAEVFKEDIERFGYKF
jgi:hypothetical protein